MRCKYCGEEDETHLFVRTSVINGRVEHIVICFKCFRLAEFREKLRVALNEATKRNFVKQLVEQNLKNSK